MRYDADLDLYHTRRARGLREYDLDYRIEEDAGYGRAGLMHGYGGVAGSSVGGFPAYVVSHGYEPLGYEVDYRRERLARRGRRRARERYGGYGIGRGGPVSRGPR